jgi:hypothetical protein
MTANSEAQPTTDQIADLAVARRLVEAGIPVFVARPDAGTDTGFRLPRRWQTFQPLAEVVDRWQPGWALCAVMGYGLDLVDVDPRNDGDLEEVTLKPILPRRYLEASTPSGGRHYFIASLGERSRTNLLQGIDYKAGDGTGADGGHGFAFIAPTVRASKVTGELVAYRWTHDDLDAFEGGGGDDAGHLRALIAGAGLRQRALGETRPSVGPPASIFDQPSRALPALPAVIPEGSRHQVLLSFAGVLRNADMPVQEALELVLDAARTRCRPPWPDSEATDLVRDVWDRYPAGARVPLYDPAMLPSSPGAAPDGSVPDAADGPTMFSIAVAAEVQRLKVKDEAHRVYRLETVGHVPPIAPTVLTDFLAVPDEPAQYRINGLWPVGGNVLLAAQYKAGKTTLVGNLVRSIADGTNFLGRFPVERPEGRVVILDTELDERTLRRWLRTHEIARTDQVAVVPLRGRVSSLNLLDAPTVAEWGQKLRDAQAGLVILDPLRPVLDALGLDENREAGRILVGFDRMLHEAGISEGLIVHHFGHGAERARGDSRILDWPDAIWKIKRDRDEHTGEAQQGGRRYLSAEGRDVDVPEGTLIFDEATRHLTFKEGSREATKHDATIEAILVVLRERDGRTQNELERALAAQHGQKPVRDGLREAIRRELIVVEPGANRSRLHMLAPQKHEPGPFA